MCIWDGEKSLVVACIKWAKRYYGLDSEEDLTIVRLMMGDLFDLIPFAAMDPLEFIDFQSEYEGMLTDEEIAKMIKEFSIRSKQSQLS